MQRLDHDPGFGESGNYNKVTAVCPLTREPDLLTHGKTPANYSTYRTVGFASHEGIRNFANTYFLQTVKVNRLRTKLYTSTGKGKPIDSIRLLVSI